MLEAHTHDWAGSSPRPARTARPCTVHALLAMNVLVADVVPPQGEHQGLDEVSSCSMHPLHSLLVRIVSLVPSGDV